MIDKVVVFDIWGEYGYFRRGYTTTSTISYPFPSRTTLAGIISGILGYDRDSYYDKFKYSNSAFAMQIVNPIKKMRMNLNLIDTKTGFLLSDNKGTRFQLPAEILKDLKYRIYLWIDEQNTMRELHNLLLNHKTIYTPYLGITECIANIGIVDDGLFDLERKEANGDKVEIKSIIPRDKAKIKIESGKKYGSVKVPTLINSDRIVEDFKEFYYEEEGKGIIITEGEYYSVGDTNVIFF
ncbi:MAG: type I-B CRISPR-associated protein Cas5b [Methanobacteriaceae archaeon]